MYFDGTSKFDWGYSLLGFPPQRICLENARLTGRELSEALLQFTGIEISVTYGIAILRQFREDVLEEFFNQHPSAAFLSDWHHVADAVAEFTQNAHYPDLFWYPNRAAVIDACQKRQLLNSSFRGRPRWYHNSKEIRVYSVSNGQSGKMQNRYIVYKATEPCSEGIAAPIIRNQQGRYRRLLVSSETAS